MVTKPRDAIKYGRTWFLLKGWGVLRYSQCPTKVLESKLGKCFNRDKDNNTGHNFKGYENMIMKKRRRLAVPLLVSFPKMNLIMCFWNGIYKSILKILFPGSLKDKPFHQSQGLCRSRETETCTREYSKTEDILSIIGKGHQSDDVMHTCAIRRRIRVHHTFSRTVPPPCQTREQYVQ